MTANPFLTSPFETNASDFADTKPTPAARGIAPTRSDLIKRAEELDIDPKLALSFFSQESSGNWNSRDSNKGARGGMQVMPDTYRMMMGTGAGQDNPWNNMEAGLRYIRYGQDTLKTRDPELLAAGYHAGYDRKDLKAGRIPNTSDGSITTADYARSVAGRVGKTKLTADDFSDKPVTPKTTLSASDFSDTPIKKTSTIEESDGSFIGDIGRNLKIGFNTAAQDVQELVGKIPVVGEPIVKGLDAVDEYFSGKKSSDLLKEDTKAMQEGMTPEMQGALQKKWWDADKNTFGSAWSDPRSYVGGVVQSLPEQALTMVPSMALAKAAYGAKIAAGVAPEVASAAAARAASIAGGVSEGLLGGAQSSREVRDQVMELKADVLEQSEAFNALRKSGMSYEQAQTTLANDAASRAFITSGVTTGLFGGMGDRALAKIFTESAGKLTGRKLAGNMAKGAVAEGLLEEAPQSAAQQVSQNEALQKANPNVKLSDDVLNQTLGGAVLGGLQGGGMAGVASRSTPEPTPPAPPASEQPAAPAPEAAAPAPAPEPTKPAGPLTKAVETAAGGGTKQEIVGEDGIIYEATTGPDGVKFVAKQPTPLTDAVAAAAEEHAANPVETPAPDVIHPVTGETVKPTDQNYADVVAGKGSAAPEEARAAVEAAPASEPVKAAKDMTDEELKARLAYIVDQAKTNGGWTNMLMKQRRALENEVEARTPKVEEPKAETLKASDFTAEPPKAAEPVAQATPAQEAAAELPKELAGAKPRYNFGNKAFELKFASDVDRAAYIAAQEKPSKRDAEYLKHAMDATGMSEAEVRAHGAQVREAIKAMAKDAKPGTLKVAEQPRGAKVEKTPEPVVKESLTPEPKAEPTTTELMQAAKSAGKLEVINVTNKVEPKPEPKPAAAPTTMQTFMGLQDAMNGSLKDGPVKALLSANRMIDDKGGLTLKGKGLLEQLNPTGIGAKPLTTEEAEQIVRAAITESAPAEEPKAEPAPVTETPKLTKATKEDLDHLFGTDKKRAAALDRIAKGTAYFGTAEKAKDFITKNGLKDTHEVVQTGKVRFEVKAKEQSNVTDNSTERKPNGPEAVVEKADAGQAEATPVQPNAEPAQEEVKPTTLAQRRAKAKADVSPKAAEIDTSTAPVQTIDTFLAENERPNWRTDEARARDLANRLIEGGFVSAEQKAALSAAKSDQTDLVSEISKIIDAARGQNDELDAEMRSYEAKAEAQAKPDQFAGNKIFTQSAVDKARARMKSKLNQLNSGLDPELVMDGMTIAGAYIESGVRTFTAYSKAMIDDFGPKIKPFLLSFYEAARNYPGLNNAGMTPVADAKAEFDALNTTTDTQPNAEAKGNDNGPQKLDQSGSRELEGKQPDALQGAEPQREAGPSAQGSSGTDLFGDERTGSERPQPAGSVGDNAREVPAAASGERAGRGGEQGRKPVQRGERAAKPDTPERDTGNQPSLIPEDGTRAQDRADGFVITEDDAIGEGGQKTKFKQNVAAIRLLKELTAENRQATRAEQAVLAKYVGWGGIPQAFYRDNNEVTKGWEKEAAELKSLMTEDELAAAAASTRNAHYTSTEIVGAVWDAAKHFGFQGGRVLEPSVGVGNFFGLMPTTVRSASQLTGVELDHITGGIAKQLYPQANINAPVGFQDFSAPDNYFDLAIGNPPFGREGIYDPTRKKISGFSIHNYFFAKSIDTVRPNGVLAMVVTNRLLDSMGDKARSYIADRAEFLGAIRLPNDAFAKNAGTEVTTDIIFLRKLKEGEQPTGQRWMDVRQYKDKDGNSVPLNEYFVRNPDMMLGDFGQYGSMYSAEDAALVARPGQDTPALLKAAIGKLPQGFMDGPTAEPVRETVEPMHDVSHVKVGSVFEQGGQIFERREDMLGKQQAAPVVFASDKAKDRVSGMIKVRDALIDVRSMQLTEGVDEKALEAARATLNKTYDAFVKANGPLNADANKRLMRDDPTWPQIAALEDGFDKGISATVAKTTGETPRAPSAKKAAIFSKRTQSPYHAPEKATSAKDAMVSSLSERGRVDLDYMASLYGKTPEAIAKELEGLIFKNPAGGWESRDQYLSGNVKKKLAQAIDAAKADPSLKGNVDALKAVQPADIEAVDIDVKTGAHWVPADVMQTFVEHVSEGANAKAIYNPVSASWTLTVERTSQAAQTQYSTDRATLRNVLEAAANQKQLTIYDKFADGTRTLNEAATTAANEKVERVKAEWKNWLWSDDARRERLARIYNDTFNTDVQREYDGSHLTFPGKVGDDIIQLRPHQANAVWRMVQSGTTLLDHVVGAGKTFTMIAGIMEMRRMGLAKKPMLVVPNHLVGQWAEDFMKLYPGANILAATKKDFEKGNRKKLFARIATGDWDAVIVAHSSLGKVEVEPVFQEAFIKQQIADMDTSIVAMREAEGKGSRNVKQIEKQKASLEEKLKKLFDTGSKDDNLHFGELGVDAMLLDEAHEFKNLGFSTGMQRVAGLGNPTGSNKAADMFMKVQATLKRTGGKNVVFATGTPISNTMAEMYTMQRYLDYATLKDQGIAHFDAWAKTFGEVVTDWELSPSGQYKMNSRFAKFVNMPELMQRYQSFADVINRDDINRQLAAQGKKLPVPKVKGGKPENTVVERSRDQAIYIGIPTVDENGVENYPQGSLVWRAENLPKKVVKGADNMLKIMSDARKAALDMRLIDPSYGDNPGSKVNVAATNIKDIYDRTAKDKGTQLVFIDLSTPKGAVAKEAAALRELVALAEDGDEAAQAKLDAMSPDELLALDSSFSVYDDLKAKLIAKGIPENEIAFIHDAGTELQKDELFGKVRTGRVRVLFGSTAKMGAGMNVQDRLVALHHLDAPWRPSDLEQREGRIIRQGNKLYEANPEGFEVEIKRYATKQTLDSRMWQTIEAKARFIEQVRKGTGEREVEDVAGEASNSAEMKAASSGNPLILEEMSLRQAIRKLENQQAEHNREQFRIKDRMRMSADMARAYDANADEMTKDATKVPKEFAATIGNQTFDKPKEAGEAILSAANAMHNAREESREIGTYGGFRMILDDVSSGDTRGAILTLKGVGEYQVTANQGSDPTGLGQRLRNTVRDLAEMAENKREQAQRMRDDIPKLESQIKPWGQEQELTDSKARHMAVIDQLKPKKKEEPKPEGDVRANRANDLESIFAALDGRGLVRKRALDSLNSRPDGDAIKYIEDNWTDILYVLEESGSVEIKC